MSVRCIGCGVQLKLEATANVEELDVQGICCPYCDSHIVTLKVDGRYRLKVSTKSRIER